MSGIFITGTDTSVGKTVVARGIAAAAKERGLAVGVMKPAETGCEEINGKLFPRDANLLKISSGCPEDINLICPFMFSKPLAPGVAARLEGLRVDIDLIRKNFEILKKRNDLVVVEGAGGLLVPIFGDYLMVNLAKGLNIPIIIVSRTTLGTINHTLLTVKAARQYGVNIIGIVLNNNTQTPKFLSESNLQVIQELSGETILGVLPYWEKLNDNNKLIKRREFAQFVEKNLELERILNY